MSKENKNIKIKTKGSGKMNFSDKLKATRNKWKIARSKEKEAAIENSLSEIYKDKNGNKIDVDKFKIKKKRGFVFWFLNIIALGLLTVVVIIGAYYYIFNNAGTDSKAVDFSIEVQESVLVNEEFVYTINYKNSNYVPINNVRIDIKYPDNFIFIESNVNSEENKSSWKIGKINANSAGKIEIKGKMIGKLGDSGVLLAKLFYTPENFSSEFSKETSHGIVIKDIGLELNFDYSTTSLVDEEKILLINFKLKENNFLDDFYIRLEAEDNIEVIEAKLKGNEESISLKLSEESDKNWKISGVQDLSINKDQVFEIKYNVKEKINDRQNIGLFFEKDIIDEKIVFYEKNIETEVMKSDLNLSLIINGSQEDESVDFGEKLNYSIIYANKGETAMKNISIMVVLDSDFLNWTTLSDLNMGKESGNTITWTKNEVSKLEKLDVNSEGTIDFSINVKDFKENDLGKDFKIKNYAQYTVKSSEENEDENATSTEIIISNNDSRSNLITNIINSNLSLKEEVRYFNDNNIAVGKGPLPPEVGKETSFRIYWDLSNNLHDLNDLKVETILPNGIIWNDKIKTSVGEIKYDFDQRKVIWEIGRLPMTVPKVSAEFDISVIPEEKDRNKIMIISSGSTVSAIDVDTNTNILKTSLAKTSKLEDDEIAAINNDGVVK